MPQTDTPTAALSPQRTRKQPQRASLHGIHSLDRFVLTVPDLDEAARYFDAFGLDVRRVDGRLDLYTFGHPQRWASIHATPGVKKKLQYLRFGCFAEDLAAITERLDRLGTPRCAPHPLGDASGVWVLHPDGYPVQITVTPKSSPEAKSLPLAKPEVPLGVGAAPSRAKVKKVTPRRLSHALFFTPDPKRAIQFNEQVLGLRVSDSSGDAVVFMHGIHGSDHHLIALAQSDGPGLHHSSWDVASLDEVGMGMEQMLAAGHARGWGVGRHVLGSNYFYYVRDPWGSYTEYSFDIDYVPGDFDWPYNNHPPEDSFYVWGPAVPADFVTNFEVAEAASAA